MGMAGREAFMENDKDSLRANGFILRQEQWKGGRLGLTRIPTS